MSLKHLAVTQFNRPAVVIFVAAFRVMFCRMYVYEHASTICSDLSSTTTTLHVPRIEPEQHECSTRAALGPPPDNRDNRGNPRTRKHTRKSLGEQRRRRRGHVYAPCRRICVEHGRRCRCRCAGGICDCGAKAVVLSHFLAVHIKCEQAYDLIAGALE